MARMMRHAALVREHASYGKKRACPCCISENNGKKQRRTARRVEKREWKKEF